MRNSYSISVLFPFVMSLLLFVDIRAAYGTCRNPAECFCYFYGPYDNEYLIRARITGVDIGSAEVLLTVESLFKIPENPDVEMNVGEEYPCEYSPNPTSVYAPQIAEGDVGLFVVAHHSTSDCRIRGYLREDNGWYKCAADPDFKGARELHLVDVLLSGNCSSEALRLGLTNPCDDAGCTCPPSDSATGETRGSVALVAVVLVALLRGRGRAE